MIAANHAAHSHSRPPQLAAQLSAPSPNSLGAARPLFLFPSSVILTKAAFLCSHTDRKPHRFPSTPLANEKFGVIFNLCTPSRIPRGCELWPLPVRACHEFPLHGCTWHQKTQPASSRKSSWLFWLWEPVRRSCVPRFFARYDHFSAIRSVFLWLCSPLCGGEFCWGVSFDSDYSGEGDASFLLFFEVRCCSFLLRGHHDGVRGHC
jgi:hypothetical protein